MPHARLAWYEADVDRQQLLDVLDQVRAGTLSAADAAGRLSDLPYAEVVHAVGSTLIDHHRELRTGVPEIVFGAGKTPEQIAGALRELARRSGGAIATRVDPAKARALQTLVPEMRTSPVKPGGKTSPDVSSTISIFVCGIGLPQLRSPTANSPGFCATTIAAVSVMP